MASQTVHAYGDPHENFACQAGVPFTPLNYPDYYRVASFDPYCKTNAELQFQSCVRGANGQADALLHCTNQQFFTNAACASAGTTREVLGCRSCQ